MKPKQILFFATRADLEPGLERYESETGSAWYRTESENGAADLGPLGLKEAFPHLGECNVRSQSQAPILLSLHRDCHASVRQEQRRKRGSLWTVDQEENPGSIVVVAGGVYSSSVVVAGRVATASSSPFSSSLMKAFELLVLEGFKKVGQYRVGPGAADRAAHGARLVTMGADEPLEYDLRQP